MLIKEVVIWIVAIAELRTRAGQAVAYTYGPGSPPLNTDPGVGSKADQFDVAVDEGGHVYEWNAWRGKWCHYADSLARISTTGLRVKQTILGPIEPRSSEEAS